MLDESRRGEGIGLWAQRRAVFSLPRGWVVVGGAFYNIFHCMTSQHHRLKPDTFELKACTTTAPTATADTNGHGRRSTNGYGRRSTNGHGRHGTNGHGRRSTDGHGRQSTNGHGRDSTNGHGRRRS